VCDIGYGRVGNGEIEQRRNSRGVWCARVGKRDEKSDGSEMEVRIKVD
jgi:hypothetical protein